MTPEQADAVLELHAALSSLLAGTNVRGTYEAIVPIKDLTRVERAFGVVTRLALFHDALQIMRDNLPRIGLSYTIEGDIKNLLRRKPAKCRHCGDSRVTPDGVVCQECPRPR